MFLSCVRNVAPKHEYSQSNNVWLKPSVQAQKQTTTSPLCEETDRYESLVKMAQKCYQHQSATGVNRFQSCSVLLTCKKTDVRSNKHAQILVFSQQCGNVKCLCNCGASACHHNYKRKEKLKKKLGKCPKGRFPEENVQNNPLTHLEHLIWFLKTFPTRFLRISHLNVKCFIVAYRLKTMKKQVRDSNSSQFKQATSLLVSIHYLYWVMRCYSAPWWRFVTKTDLL